MTPDCCRCRSRYRSSSCRWGSASRSSAQPLGLSRNSMPGHSAGHREVDESTNMAFSLIDETEGAVPIAALTKGEFPAWLDKAPERERNWLASISFSAEAGKHALIPG